MIIDNTYMPAYQTTTRIGPDFFVFCFDGAVPASVSEIPFELFTSSNYVGVNSNIDEAYKIYNWQNIYNNCIHHSLIRAKTGTDYDGNDLRTEVEFEQKNSSIVAYPKLSFYDNSISKYRHVPKTFNTDLNGYAIAAANSPNTNTYHHYYGLGVPGWNTQSTYGVYWAIPNEDRQRAEGFYFESDFGYEAGIDYINVNTLATNMFRGDMLVYSWDATLNEGAGDWVLEHTESPTPAENTITITFAEQVLTSKIRLEFTEAHNSTNYTVLTELEFIGATPMTEPEPTEMTWALIIPQLPKVAAWMEYSHEGAFILATAGGPGSTADLIFNRSAPLGGRNCPLLSGNYKFLPYEV